LSRCGRRTEQQVGSARDDGVRLCGGVIVGKLFAPSRRSLELLSSFTVAVPTASGIASKCGAAVAE